MAKANTVKIVFICDKVVVWGLYALAFIFPLFFLPFNASVLEINKQLLLLVFSLVLLMFWIGKVIAGSRMELKKGILNLGIVMFLVFSAVSAALSKNLFQGLVGGSGTVAESFFSVLSCIIIFFVLINSIKTRQEVLNLVFSFVVSGLVFGVFALLQLTGKFLFPWDFAQNVAFNTVGSLNSLEIMAAALLTLCIALFAESDSKIWRQIFFAVLGIFFLGLALSINFANVWWGLLLASIVIIALGIINREQMSQYRLILPMVVLVFSVLMILTTTNIFTKWVSVPAEVSPSFKASVDIGKSALKENLFFGSGPGSYSYTYGLYRSPTLNETDFWNVRFNQGFSKVFSQPATLGLAGFLTWILILVGFSLYGFIMLVRRRGENWALALGLFSSWLVLALLQFLYSTNLTLELVFWILLGLSFLTLKTLSAKGASALDFGQVQTVSVEFSRNSPMASVLSFVFVVVIVLAISVFYIGGSYYYADILYQKGLALIDDNKPEDGSVTISRAVILNPYNDAYLRTLSQAALLRVNNEFNKPQTAERDGNIQNLIATAINIGKRATDLAPLNVDNWVQRASIYRAVIPYTAGADQWALDTYKEATKLEPQNPYYFYELGRSYLFMADLAGNSSEKEQKDKVPEYLQKAEESLNQSIALKPDYALAIYQLALVYDAQGEIDKAIPKIKDAQAMYPNDVGLAFQLGLLYYKQANWNLAKEQLERAVLLDQNYSNARYFLGLIYDRQGNRQGAIDQFTKIAELNPDNQDVKTILANLNAGKPAITQQQTPEGAPIQQ